MPTAKGYVVVIDIPVTTFNLAQQSALWPFGSAEYRVWADVVGQYREQKRIFAVLVEQVEVAHQVKP